jgi:hypothetical protein
LSAPLLRTLSPALRGLERSLRAWLDGSHRYPLSTIDRATLEGLSTDLRRQAEALDVDRPLLVIMLMGGTGVGKSTLLNALAEGAIAQSSIVRPTTRDPVVYYHESIRHERLDPALRHCRLIPHDRPALEQKIIVDTPDVDSNDLANRDKLIRLLPVADVILYVGSQEKYHDELGWELFRQQRRRRAFGFVLNKWDRCVQAGAEGLRPDEDLRRDLEAQGFHNPLLFRTCSQSWLDAAAAHVNGQVRPRPADLPEGEQFPELIQWLEQGLSRLEIEAIKARGVSQMLTQMHQTLESIKPPDLAEVAERTRAAWLKPLAEESEALTEVLLNTLEPYQREIELHFALEGQRRFRGLMGGYLSLVTRLKYAGSSVRDRFSQLPRRGRGPNRNAPPWDLSLFTQACSEAAANRQIDARGKALANRLLVEADNQGFPVDLLNQPVEEVSQLDWRSRHARALSDVLQQVEQQWTKPGGGKRLLHAVIGLLADWVPVIALLAALFNLLWRVFDPNDTKQAITWVHVLLPLIVLLVVLVILHMLIAYLMPMRWTQIRGEFEKLLHDRLQKDLEEAFVPVPAEVVQVLQGERIQVEKLAKETHEVASWLQQREQASSVAGLYGQ